MLTLFQKCIPLGTFLTIATLPAFASTLNNIAKDGEFRLGFREGMQPFSSATADGKAEGYSVDICLEIHKNVQEKLGKEIKLTFVPVQSKNRLNMLETDQIHVECGITTNTQKRKKRIDFSHHFFAAGAALLVKKDSPIKDTSDLKGKKLGHIKNTTSVGLIKNNPELKGGQVQLVAFDQYNTAFNALKNGNIDAFYGDDTTQWSQIIQSQSPKSYVILPKRYSVEPYSIGIKKDKEFKKLVDKTTLHLFKSREIRKMYNKWFVTGRTYPLKPSLYFNEIVRRPSDIGIQSISF